MATGSEISAVCCAAELRMLPRAPFSQCSLADEAPLFVSQTAYDTSGGRRGKNVRPRGQ